MNSSGQGVVVQICIRFNGDNHDELVTNGKYSVFFWHYFKEKLNSGEPEESLLKATKSVIKAREVQEIEAFTCSVFIPMTETAVTGTIDGGLVVWEEGPGFQVGQRVTDNRHRPRVMHAVKLVRLHNTAITTLVTKENYVIIGGADGFMRFYDNSLGLVGWFEELNSGEITSISFSAKKHLSQSEAQSSVNVPPFIVGTSKSCMLMLSSGSLEKQPGTFQYKVRLIF
eukprot:Gb_40877 [translate_table: standard]